jgi:DNA-binding MarR family transcriptional regulator
VNKTEHTAKYERLFELMHYWQEYETNHDDDLEQFSVWLNKRASQAKRHAGSDHALYAAPIRPSNHAETSNGSTHSSHYSARNYQENVSKEVASERQGRYVQTLGITSSYNDVSPEQIQSCISPQSLFQNKSQNQVHQHPPESIDPYNYHRFLPIDWQIGILLGRLSRFLMFYTKKSFAELDIPLSEDGSVASQADFGILACVKTLGNPKKSEVIGFTLLEKTTGTEMMKRMIRQGLLHESDDEEDKRSKRVSLTEKGLCVHNLLLQKLMELSCIITGNLPENRKAELAEMLDYLNHFHNEIYFHQYESSIHDIIERNLLQFQKH